MPIRPLAGALAISLFAVLTAPSRAYATPLHFQDCQNQTGRNASVVIDASSQFYLLTSPAQVEMLAPGDELAAFTPDGSCAGAVAWDGQTAMLSLWEDDPLTTVKDGFAPGDPIVLRAWDASASTELISLYIDYQALFETSGLYSTNTIHAPSFAIFSPTVGGTAGPAGARASTEKAEASQKGTSVALPKDFTLSSNYPNPFRSSTTIRYGLPEAAAVRLDVYDALGRHVTTLVDEVQQPAWYEVELQAQDLAAGLYIYRFRADDFVSDRRMMLVR